jgi:archaellum component FlaC
MEANTASTDTQLRLSSTTASACADVVVNSNTDTTSLAITTTTTTSSSSSAGLTAACGSSLQELISKILPTELERSIPLAPANEKYPISHANAQNINLNEYTEDLLLSMPTLDNYGSASTQHTDGLYLTQVPSSDQQHAAGPNDNALLSLSASSHLFDNTYGGSLPGPHTNHMRFDMGPSPPATALPPPPAFYDYADGYGYHAHAASSHHHHQHQHHQHHQHGNDRPNTFHNQFDRLSQQPISPPAQSRQRHTGPRSHSNNEAPRSYGNRRVPNVRGKGNFSTSSGDTGHVTFVSIPIMKPMYDNDDIDSSIKTLKRQIEGQEKVEKSQKQKIGDLQAEVKKLQSQHDLMRKTLTELSNEKDDSDVTVNHLKGCVSELKAAKAALEANVAELRAANIELFDKNQVLTARARSRAKTTGTTKHDNETADEGREQTPELDNRVLELVRLLQKSTQLKNDAINRVDELQEENAALLKRIEEGTIQDAGIDAEAISELQEIKASLASAMEKQKVAETERDDLANKLTQATQLLKKTRQQLIDHREKDKSNHAHKKPKDDK